MRGNLLSYGRIIHWDDILKKSQQAFLKIMITQFL